MEITSSGVSVYEVVLDLNHWQGLLSNQIPGFTENLIRFMPSTAGHKCMSGEAGGFHAELTKGTNFGHVVEHVLLELIRLADPNLTEYSGWTKSVGAGRYIIHYGAPGLLVGRLAAILAVEIVARLQQGEVPDLDSYVARMQHPMDYFNNEGPGNLDPWDGFLPEPAPEGTEHVPPLTDWQRDNLQRVMAGITDRTGDITASWAQAFCAFGGDFARGILDKIELLNPDQSWRGLVAGEFETYFQSVAGFSQMMRSLHIPLNFMTHSAWLYKNLLQVVMLESLADDRTRQIAVIDDLDAFYQNVFARIVEGYSRPAGTEGQGPEVTLCAFRARHVRTGTVLVVDDDMMARKVARDILESHGIPTRGARDGLAALNLLATEGSAIDVVLLDLVMPGLDGLVVCRRIRESHPNKRIILYSGLPLPPENQHLLDEHVVVFLQKPFPAKRLVSLVRELMDLQVLSRGTPVS